MIRFIVVVVLTMSVVALKAQENPLFDSLKTNLQNAKSNEQKVYWLGQLAHVYMPVDRKISDDFASKQQQIAELSRDRALMAQGLITNARRYYNLAGRQDNIDKGVEYS